MKLFSGYQNFSFIYNSDLSSELPHSSLSIGFSSPTRTKRHTFVAGGCCKTSLAVLMSNSIDSNDHSTPIPGPRLLEFYTFLSTSHIMMLDVYVGFPQEFLFLGSHQMSLELNTFKQFRSKNGVFVKTDSVYVFEKTVENYFGNL
jgi:hypothetical protein